MLKRALSLTLLLAAALGLLLFPANAAPSLDEAMAEVDIYARDEPLNWLTMNGSVKTQQYTYYRYTSVLDGSVKEIPAYCVNPTTNGVPQTVPEGTSIQYACRETVSDPKVCGIVANGYPHVLLRTLGLETPEEAYYATKTALWCYLLGNWDISGLGINPRLTGKDRETAERVLEAVRQIYTRGMTWDRLVSPRLTAVPDRDMAYPVTWNGASYYQQIFTVTSETWATDQQVQVSLGEDAPAGAFLADRDGNPISQLLLDTEGPEGYQGQFRVLYPADSIEGRTGSVRISLSATVVQYAIYYAECAETDRYGNLQHYMLDTDPHIPIQAAVVSSYSGNPDGPSEPETGLRLTKLETGTDTPLAGAIFSVTGPDGEPVGSFSSDENGEVLIPLTQTGLYTVTEDTPPRYHLLPEERTRQVTVRHGEVAEVTFWNAPYGSLSVRKLSNTGDPLEGVTIQITHVESGLTYTRETGPGGTAFFDRLKPGAWEVREIAGIEGWEADTGTIQTITVIAGETAETSVINKELPGLRITKYERGSMEQMPNVSFEIFRDAESLGIFQTDQLGEILLTDCEPGTYRVVEVNTGGDSHVLDTTPQEVELKAGDGIKELVFFNDRLPGIHLIKVDSADLSKPIANARFRIEAVDGSWGPMEYTTLEDGTIDLSKLPVGSYVVTELECPGYIVDDAQRIIHLDGGDQAQFIFTNSKLPSLTLIKTSSDGTPLGGVTYRLAKIEDGSRYLDRTTGPDGTITWEGLEPGVYSLQEVSTGSDHILDPKEYHVELFAGKDSTICLQNDKRPNLTVVKRDADSGEPVADTVFLVEAADGQSVDEIKTGPDGTAVLENLLPGVYEISEKSVPSPYLMDSEPQLVTLYPNRDHTVYFENHKRPTVTVQKENSITHDPIQYAEFHITWASNKTDTGELRDLWTFQTDEAGQIILEGIEDGWLKIEETEPAPGFQAPEDPVTEVYVKGGENKTVTISNTPLSALVVYKRDSVTGAGISGCLFQLRYLGGETSGVDGTVVGTYVTSANGSFTVTGLKKGYYICEELESDSGHVIDAAPQSFYISGEDQDIVTLYFTNTPKGAVLVKKVSANDNAPLSDVEFLVTTSDGAVVGDANGKFVTDSTGSFLISGIDPGTTLVIKETRAKPGYLLDDTPQTVQVQEGQTVTVEFRNQPTGQLIVHKLSSSDKTPLEGVQFKITYADGSFVDAEGGKQSSNGLYWTNEDGQIILSGLTGTVVVTEEKTIEGFAIHEETRRQAVTINPDDTQELYFYNDPIGGVELVKVSSADKTERLSGVTFEIRRVSDDALIDTVTTGRDGRVYLPLESGDYYAVETESAKGFKLDGSPIYFTVRDGETTRKTVTNAPFSGILIRKVSSADGSGISGGHFLLYNARHIPIGEYVSDQRGHVYIDDLTESGRYYLRELENEGYIPDTELKTVYVKAGEVTEIEWENTPITGQIQIIKKSADYNPTTGLPAGTLLEGAVFEIYDKAGNLVDTIRSDSRGLAVSKQLPLSRYTIREVKAPEHYGVNETELTAYLEHEGQIVRFEAMNKSLTTGVAITKTGPREIMGGQPVRYVFSDIANTSNVRLDSFYFRDTLPAQVRLDTVVTGTYNFPGTYKVVYRVNGGGYRTLADNLSTSKNYTLAASAAALGLASNERVTEVMFVFGQAPAGFAQVETPYLYCTAVGSLPSGSFTNVADAGGVYNGQWVQAVSRWVTSVYGKTTTLPRTGY